MTQFANDEAVMQHAIEIARRGEGLVEPNPMVGAVIVDSDLRLLSEGWHERFGDHHAEVNAIRGMTEDMRGKSLFVTLEPCSHHGKTPPCADAVIKSGFARVVIGSVDPAPHVAGKGIERIRSAGVDVQTGLLADQTNRLIAPFRKLFTQQKPWVHAKWAMTLDGKIATSTGHSKWISNEQSRACVHQLRGRMDAIITGAGTVRSDDPQLTARPPGPRTPLRVVLDSTGTSVSPDSRLVQTIDQAPVLLVISSTANNDHVEQLSDLGCEILACQATDSARPNLDLLLAELGKRQMTNVLIEAGAGLLGSAIDRQLVDEVHVFVCPKLIGGSSALTPVAGKGLDEIPSPANIVEIDSQRFGSDIYFRGDVIR